MVREPAVGAKAYQGRILRLRETAIDCVLRNFLKLCRAEVTERPELQKVGCERAQARNKHLS
eukprot:14117352-Alexandrium_andersonii.AAC.1